MLGREATAALTSPSGKRASRPNESAAKGSSSQLRPENMASASTVPLAESLRLYFGRCRAFGYTRTFYYFRPFLPELNLSLRNRQQPGWGRECDATITFL
jgi:hypothetical protein